MGRFKDPNAVGSTTCLAFSEGGAINNYGYSSLEDIPTEPQVCPRLAYGKICGALVVMSAVNVDGLRHVANAQLAEGQQCSNTPRPDTGSTDLMDMIRKTYG